ncbi:MAG: XRE family transcriptional regulator [Pseudomonadota bacterium]
MSVGVEGFEGGRLEQARKARGLTATALAELVNLTQPNISLYEKNRRKPTQPTLDNLARALNVPVRFFLSPIRVSATDRLFYRSMSAATKAARARAEAKYEWALQTLEYLTTFFDFPELNLPEIAVPSNHRSLESQDIESIAAQVRAYWGLDNKPIANVIQTLEGNGVVVWRTPLEARTLDAFSEYREPHPIVVLSSDKENFFRSRFDAAHELGHLLLHRSVDTKSLRSSTDFKLIEQQAHEFAGAFLLPAESYSKDVWSPTIDTFRALKSTWNVSIALQIKRCADLGLVSESQEKRLWINRARRGWSKLEPLDQSTDVEHPTLIKTAIEMLLNEKVRSSAQLVADVELSAIDLEQLAELPQGLLTGAFSRVEPRLKSRQSNVLPFGRN